MNFARRLRSHLPPLVTAILGAACVAATPQLEFQSQWLDAVTNGALHGTFYAHAALAGLWVACGPGSLVVRLVTVAMWLPLLPYVYILGQERLHNVNIDHHYPAMVIGCLATTSLVTATAVGGFAFWTGLHWDTHPTRRRRQFGLGGMLLTMTAVPVLILAARFAEPALGSYLHYIRGVFVAYAAAAVAIAIPLTLAGLAGRPRWLFAAAAVPLVVAGVERALFGLGWWNDEPVLDLYLVNVVQTLWAVVFTLLLHACGLRPQA